MLAIAEKHAYVLMTNHHHLLVEALEANLSPAMQWLQTSYGMWFNRKYGRAGGGCFRVWPGAEGRLNQDTIEAFLIFEA